MCKPIGVVIKKLRSEANKEAAADEELQRYKRAIPFYQERVDEARETKLVALEELRQRRDEVVRFYHDGLEAVLELIDKEDITRQ